MNAKRFREYIPEELKALPQWAVYKTYWQPEKGKRENPYSTLRTGIGQSRTIPLHGRISRARFNMRRRTGARGCRSR